ncbi:PIN domain-like family protein [Actinidia rufa]|uniref:PIN domain-like family protein n=1 Tax=Actinidia rufa TaxID=165716 RepID=A0A7J0GZK5_9ERIC|nr:PIN domain-like family protein [Actinidia rufa]
MRLKKQKRHRKIVRFYTACFGFREPFKVLCDGTFVNHLLVNRITPADTALSNILGATVKIFTTRCVLAELKSLGESYSESLKAATNLITARCDHEKRKSAVACITEIIGAGNPEHFFVATQDADLRKKFQELPGVPLIFGLRNALLLEPPSAFQRQFAKSTEEERSQMSELEYKMLRMKKKTTLATEEAMESYVNESEGDQNLHTQTVTKMNTGRKRKEVKDKIQFKRKKAKVMIRDHIFLFPNCCLDSLF